jgi:uncharacterized protein YndB with AHSA1/START domain
VADRIHTATARVERVLPATPDVVYARWVDAATLAEFIAPTPGTAQVAIDPRIGGHLRIVMTFPDRRIEIEGEYLVVESPHRLSFTWRSLTGGFACVVTVTCERHGDGETLMRIVHSQLPSTIVDDFLGGWVRIQDQLAELLRS